LAIVSIAADLGQHLERCFAALPVPAGLDLDARGMRGSVAELDDTSRQALQHLGSCSKALLRSNGFAVLKGVPKTPDARGLMALACQIGEVFDNRQHQASTVIEASPTIDAQLQGNQTEPLFLHTDFAMLETPPAVTIIHCRQGDPLGVEFGRNGIAIAQAIVSRYFGSALLDDFQSIPLPFGGRTPSGEDIVLSSPLLLKPEAGSKLARVRFHPSRIHHGFRLRGGSPTKAETRVLRMFQRAAARVRSEIGLDAGDILLINNRSALHDRGRCTLRLGLDAVHSRLVQIVFF